MRTRRTVRLLLLALAGSAIAAAPAGAFIPQRPQPVTTTAKAPPASVVVQTRATLPGARYPWVYPAWTGSGTTMRFGTTAPSAGADVQPPAWIPIT